MASSRLEKIGTIFTRVTGLIRAGAMKMEDRPIWYDLYKMFPPTLPPKFDRTAPKTEIRQIFYHEDLLRAKFHKKMGKSLPAINLSQENIPSLCQKVIHLTNKIQSEKQISFDDAFDEAFDVIKAEGHISKQPEFPTQDASLATAFKQASEKSPTSAPLNVNVKDIFKES